MAAIVFILSFFRKHLKYFVHVDSVFPPLEILEGKIVLCYVFLLFWTQQQSKILKFIQMLCFVTDVVLFTCQAEEGAGDAQRRTT